MEEKISEKGMFWAGNEKRCDGRWKWCRWRWADMIMTK